MNKRKEEFCRFRWNHCEKKIGYRSEKKAKNHIKAIGRTGQIIQNFSIYKCKFCNKWHIGHINKNRKIS